MDVSFAFSTLTLLSPSHTTGRNDVENARVVVVQRHHGDALRLDEYGGAAVQEVLQKGGDPSDEAGVKRRTPGSVVVMAMWQPEVDGGCCSLAAADVEKK